MAEQSNDRKPPKGLIPTAATSICSCALVLNKH